MCWNLALGDTIAELKIKKEAVLDAGNESYQTLFRLIRNCQIAEVLDPKEDSDKLTIQVVSIVLGFSSFVMQGIFKNFYYSLPATEKFNRRHDGKSNPGSRPNEKEIIKYEHYWKSDLHH